MKFRKIGPAGKASFLGKKLPGLAKTGDWHR